MGDFFGWCETRRVRDVAHINPALVAAYIEHRSRTHAKPTVKQELGAVRCSSTGSWSARSCSEPRPLGSCPPKHLRRRVRGPKHVVKRGKTPVLTREETRELLHSIETGTVGGLRDRALIGVLVYSFARIGAALALKVDD